MNKLASFRKNPFLTINISKNRFGKFVLTHLIKTKSRNNPAFAQIVLSTETLYNSLFGNISNLDKHSILRQSLTIQVNGKMKEFKAKVLKMESLVVVKFEKNSGTYQEFYPHGRTEYYRTNKKNILQRFERIIKATTTYEAELGSDWKTAFTQMYDEFVPIFEEQQKYKGAVALTSSDYKTIKTALCHQLYKNLLVILAEYYETPNRAKSFFDETIVNWKKPKKKKKKAKKVQEVVESKE